MKVARAFFIAMEVNRWLAAGKLRGSFIRLTVFPGSVMLRKKGAKGVLDQNAFGKRLRDRRKTLGLRQSDVAEGIRVTEQAVSKWEQGDSLPDLNNFALLATLLETSADELLGMVEREQVVKRIQVGGASIELVKRPETLYAGRIIYARDCENFDEEIGRVMGQSERAIYDQIHAPVLPLKDIHLSVNFWLPEEQRAYGFVRETTSDAQPQGLDVYRMPASLFLRARAEPGMARLLAKEKCEVWELFAYLRDYVMPAQGLRMNANGAQEMEVFDTIDHLTGCAYMPVCYREGERQ